ncbi:MAG: hypothetical protein AB8B74_08550 [Crocinitomicaceae bacterium]
MKNLLTLSILIISIVFWSCNKEKITQNSESSKNITAKSPSVSNNNPSGASFANVQQYLNTWSVQPDQFQFQANTGGTFTTQKGSILTIPANAFSYADNSLAAGTINIKVKEVYTTKEIIKTGIYPVSGTQVLNSGGQFFMEATQNGSPLIVTNGALVDLKIPAQAQDPNMELFLAGPDENNAPWEVVDSIMNGGPNTQWPASGFTFNSADDTYSINLDSLGWGNIDVFLSTNYFDCTFNLTGLSNLDNTNTNAFAVFKNQNSVWPTGVQGWGSISNSVIQETHLADVPMNIVVISVENGQLFYGLLDVTPVQNQTYTINMVATTSDVLDALIENLP